MPAFGSIRSNDWPYPLRLKCQARSVSGRSLHQPRQNRMDSEDERRLLWPLPAREEGKSTLPQSGLSTAEAAATLLVGADRAQKIDLPEGRPQHVGEIELAVGALPQEKTGQTDLAARADDQVGIGQPGGVEMLGDRLWGDALNRLRQRRIVVGHAVEQGANGISDLLAAAIGDGDIELEAVITGGRTLGSRNRGEYRLGQHRSAADRAHPHAPPVDRRISGQRLQLGCDRPQDPRDFGRRPAKIVGRKHPQGHRRNAQLDTPIENLVKLVGAEIVELPRLGDPERAAVPAIAVENDADMARGRPTLDVADEPTGIEVVKQAEHRRQRSSPHSARSRAQPSPPRPGTRMSMSQKYGEPVTKIRI